MNLEQFVQNALTTRGLDYTDVHWIGTTGSYAQGHDPINTDTNTWRLLWHDWAPIARTIQLGRDTPRTADIVIALQKDAEEFVVAWRDGDWVILRGTNAQPYDVTRDDLLEQT